MIVGGSICETRLVIQININDRSNRIVNRPSDDTRIGQPARHAITNRQSHYQFYKLVQMASIVRGETEMGGVADKVGPRGSVRGA
jgi:hypothetical protein